MGSRKLIKLQAIIVLTPALLVPLSVSADPPTQPISLTIPALNLTVNVIEYDLDTSFESGAFNARLSVRRIFDIDSGKFWNAYFSQNGTYNDVTLSNGGLTWEFDGVSIIAASASAAENRDGLNIETFSLGLTSLQFTFTSPN